MTICTLHNRYPIDITPGQKGITIRLGKEWGKVMLGDTLQLCECTRGQRAHRVVGLGRVERIWSRAFKDAFGAQGWVTVLTYTRTA